MCVSIVCECVPTSNVNGATDTCKSGTVGRRGGDLYFWRWYSQGVPGEWAAVGSSPQMAALEKPER